VEDAGVEVSGGCGCTVREGATFIGGSVKQSFADPSPSQPHSVDLGIMISPACTVDLGGAAKFGEQDDEGVINAATFVQIVEKSRETLIQWWKHLLFKAVVSIRMSVEVSSRTAIQVPRCGINRHQRHSGPGEPTGSEKTLPENVRPIAVMLALGLIINFEGSSSFFVQKHVEDPLLIVFERFGGLSATGKLSQEVPAICEALLIHALDEVKGEMPGDRRFPVVRFPFVGLHDNRVILHPEESCMLAVGPSAIIDGIRKGYVAREFALGIVSGMGDH
jgi:hypothetical protein